VQKRKKYRFSVKRLYVDDDSDLYIRRVARRNTLYIYVYEKSWLVKDVLLIALKVTVHE
jgi:hypothetical protein